MRGELLALALLALSGCAKGLPPTLSPAAIVPYQTDDGWDNSLRRYPAGGPPVLLVHGMGANHYNWDYREEISLSHALQQAGYDVWVVELRGDPGSVPPSRRARRSFTFDDHATLDLPAAVDTVLAETGHDRLLWVGHSMGGMLLYTFLAQQPDKIAGGVAICSPATFDDPLRLHRTGRRFRWMLGGNGRVPARALASATRPLGRANPMFATLGNKDNLDYELARGLARHALVDLPKPLLRQAVRWITDGDLVTVDGEPWLQPASVPLLVLGAPDDRIVSHRDVAHACSVFPDCTYRLLSQEEGFTVDYGHVDPVVGVSAPGEVYPLILEFLDGHRTDATNDGR